MQSGEKETLRLKLEPSAWERRQGSKHGTTAILWKLKFSIPMGLNSETYQKFEVKHYFSGKCAEINICSINYSLIELYCRTQLSIHYLYQTKLQDIYIIAPAQDIKLIHF